MAPSSRAPAFRDRGDCLDPAARRPSTPLSRVATGRRRTCRRGPQLRPVSEPVAHPRGRRAARARAAPARASPTSASRSAGSGDSDGLLHDEYLASELQDGFDVIAWLAAQPWCNGRVGLRGLSWGGFNSLQIAALRPPALARSSARARPTIATRTTSTTWAATCSGYDMQLWATWAHLFFVAPPDPDVVGESWRARWLERLESIEPVIATWLSHQTRDEYWRHGSVGVDLHAITAPVLMVGGWEDGYRDAIMRFVAARPANTWAVIGPWGHGWPHRCAARSAPRLGRTRGAVVAALVGRRRQRGRARSRSRSVRAGQPAARRASAPSSGNLGGARFARPRGGGAATS